MRFFLGLCFLNLISAISLHEAAHHARRSLLGSPDDACTSWILGAGYPWVLCLQSLTPPSNNITTNCTTSVSEVDAFCNDPCYQTLLDGFDYIENTGTCLSAFTGNNVCSQSNCDNATNVCYAGQCYGKCNSTAECQANPDFACQPNVVCWGPPGTEPFCSDNTTTPTDDGTQNFYSVSYAYRITCVKNPTNNMYCSLNITNHGAPDIGSWTCNDVADWGCCTGTMLNFYRYCLHETVNNEQLYHCPNSNLTCPGISTAKDYCIPICGGDDIIPANGSAGNCSSDYVYHLNEKCSQTCNEGWGIQSGSLQRTCQQNGSLSLPTAVCAPVHCNGDDSKPTYGTAGTCTNDKSYNYLEICTQTCNTGFTPSGNLQRTCLGSGSFSPSTVLCVNSTAFCLGDNDTPMHGTYGNCSSDRHFNYGDTCSQTCIPPYGLNSGSLQRTCQPNGTFTPTNAVCVDTTNGCHGDNAAPSHGTTGTCSTSYTYTVGQTCTQTCGTYTLKSGNLQRTCQADGHFTTTTAVCSIAGASSLRPTLTIGVFILFSVFLAFL